MNPIEENNKSRWLLLGMINILILSTIKKGRLQM
jgi:hypothetical protein